PVWWWRALQRLRRPPDHPVPIYKGRWRTLDGVCIERLDPPSPELPPDHAAPIDRGKRFTRDAAPSLSPRRIILDPQNRATHARDCPCRQCIEALVEQSPQFRPPAPNRRPDQATIEAKLAEVARRYDDKKRRKEPAHPANLRTAELRRLYRERMGDEV